MNPAEEVVRCWLNEKGFFTLQNRKDGLKEIDLLAIDPQTGKKLHVETKVSTNPIGAVRLRGPMRFSKQPVQDRVEEYVREKFDKASLRVKSLLNSEQYGRMFVLGRINPKYDAPNDVVKEFEKHGVKVVFFHDVSKSWSKVWEREGVRT